MPPVAAVDRIGANDPNNQGKNVSRFSHGLSSNNGRTMRRVRYGFIFWHVPPPRRPANSLQGARGANRRAGVPGTL